MKPKPIASEQEYRDALTRLKIIFDAPENTKEFNEAETLILLIEGYENNIIQ